jgi:hypothetical protein
MGDIARKVDFSQSKLGDSIRSLENEPGRPTWSTAMPIWLLEPHDLNDPNWEASSHHGPVIVRAPSEAAARQIAEEAFGVKTRFAPGKGQHLPPWQRAELVGAKIIEDTIYSEEGPDEVLEPSFGAGSVS